MYNPATGRMYDEEDTQPIEYGKTQPAIPVVAVRNPLNRGGKPLRLPAK